MAGPNDEQRRLGANTLVLARGDRHLLGARPVPALADDRESVRDRRKRAVQVLQALVDRAVERLVAADSLLTLIHPNPPPALSPPPPRRSSRRRRNRRAPPPRRPSGRGGRPPAGSAVHSPAPPDTRPT